MNFSKGIYCVLLISIIAVLPPIALAQNPPIFENQQNVEWLTFDYQDYGIKINYPDDWHMEDLAREHIHLQIHPGHLPGLPIQVFKPTQLDMRPFDKDIFVIGLWAPIAEGEQGTDANMRVIIKKIGFGQDLSYHIDSFLLEKREKIGLVNDDENENKSFKVVERTQTSLSGNPATVIVVEQKETWTNLNQVRENDFRTMRAYTIEDDKIYIIEFEGSFNAYDKHVETGKEIISSFEITSTGFYKTVWVLIVIGLAIGAILFLIIKAKRNRNSFTSFFMKNLRKFLPAALGIEILCISAVEIGGNGGLYMFGYNLQGIVLSYLLVYALAGFATFATILGRLESIQMVKINGTSEKLTKINEGISCDCCSILELGANLSFLMGLKLTLASFVKGLRRMSKFYLEPNKIQILKSSIILLFTAESGCILTAATIDFILYQYSIFLSVPISMAAGTFVVAAPHAFRQAKKDKKINQNAQKFKKSEKKDLLLGDSADSF